jgi:hypothetical protein
MLIFPGEVGNLVVISPSNIKQMKAGRPLKIGGTIVAFTPDLAAFMNIAGINATPAKRGEVKIKTIALDIDKINHALKAVRDFPEVEEG